MPSREKPAEEILPASGREATPPDFNEDDIEILTEQEQQEEPGAEVQNRIIKAAVERLIAKKFPGTSKEEKSRLENDLTEQSLSLLRENRGIKKQWLSVLSGDMQEGRFSDATEKAEDLLVDGFMRRLKERIEQ